MANNVLPIAAAQPAPACHFSINVVLRGFPVTISLDGRAGDLKTVIDRLFDFGAEPLQPSHAATAEPTKKIAPLCPDHGTPMKASRKPGSHFCPRRTDDGDYCPHKA